VIGALNFKSVITNIQIFCQNVKLQVHVTGILYRSYKYLTTCRTLKLLDEAFGFSDSVVLKPWFYRSLVIRDS